MNKVSSATAHPLRRSGASSLHQARHGAAPHSRKGPAVEILIPLAFFAMIAAIVLVPGYFRSREKERLHETLRMAYEKGQPVPPEMIEALQANHQPAPNLPDRDLRRGIILLCIAAAIVVFALIVGEYDDHGYGVAAVAAFPGFIGIGYIAFWLASRRKTLA
jgi:hypothetical protein